MDINYKALSKLFADFCNLSLPALGVESLKPLFHEVYVIQRKTKKYCRWAQFGSLLRCGRPADPARHSNRSGHRSRDVLKGMYTVTQEKVLLALWGSSNTLFALKLLTFKPIRGIYVQLLLFILTISKNNPIFKLFAIHTSISYIMTKIWEIKVCFAKKIWFPLFRPVMVWSSRSDFRAKREFDGPH